MNGRSTRRSLLIGIMILSLVIGSMGPPAFIVQANENVRVTAQEALECTRTIKAGDDVWGASAGEVICIEAGVVKNDLIVLSGLVGTREKPVRVINIGGVVDVEYAQGWTGAIEIRQSKYVILSGAGDPEHEYGFRIANTDKFGHGIQVDRGSTNIVIENVEITKAGFAGIIMRTEPTGTLKRPDFVQYETAVRHTVVQNVYNDGEPDGGYGIFIGTPNFGSAGNAIELRGVQVHHNRIENVARNGIQVAAATSDVNVYENTIVNYGFALDQDPNKRNGIYIANGTTGDFYNNAILGGAGDGIRNQGIGGVNIFNNLIVEPGANGIVSPAMHYDFHDSDEAFDFSEPTRIKYNTIVHPSKDGHGILLRKNEIAASGNEVSHNLIVHRPYGKENYVFVEDDDYEVTVADNYGTHDINEVQFVFPSGGNYKLMPGSPAQGTGYDPGMEPDEAVDPDANWGNDAGGGPGEEPGDEEEEPLVDPDYVPDPVDIACDHIIPSNDQRIWDGGEMGVEPGDIVCIEAGLRPAALWLMNFHGTEEAPITFINYGGIVTLYTDITTQAGAIKIEDCSHFILTGTGDRNTQYGFRLKSKGPGLNGISASKFSTDFIIEHVEVFGAGFAGIMTKTDPNKDYPETWRGNFVQKNVIIRNNYIHDVGGEGMYIGHSFYNGYNDRGEIVYPHEIIGLRVYNNRIENTGWDGIQVGSAPYDVKVYNNYVYNYGLEMVQWQTSGIQTNSGTSGDFFNNVIIKGHGDGSAFNNQGRGDIRIYNNLIIDPAINGIISMGRVDPDNPVYDGSPMYIAHNTIIMTAPSNADGHGIWFWNKASENAGNLAYNNLIVHKYAEEGSYAKFIELQNDEADLTYSHNFTANDLESVKFVDPENGDYRLREDSPAIDIGLDLSEFPWADVMMRDADGNERPYGSGFDAGAFEYASLPDANDGPGVRGPAAGVSGGSQDDEKRQLVGEDTLVDRMTEDGRIVIEMAQGKTEVLLPAQAAGIIGDASLVITNGEAALAIPSDVLKALFELLEESEQAGALIALRIEALDEEAAGEATAAADFGQSASVRKAGPIYRLELSVETKAGEKKFLTRFETPVTAEFPFDDDADAALLGVYHYDEKTQAWEYAGGKVDNTARVIRADLRHFSVYGVLEYEKTFADVAKSHWAHRAIQVLAAKRILTGISETMFAPKKRVTRAEFASMLVRALGIRAKDGAPFRDVPEAEWFAEAAAAAYEAGIVNGRSAEIFAPFDPITREELALMLVRALKKAGIAAPERTDAASFRDGEQVSGWAAEGVSFAAAMGIMTGDDHGYFRPKDNATRAEAAKAMFNLLQQIE